MRHDATKEQKEKVIRFIEENGLKPDVSEGELLTVIGAIGDESRLDFKRIEAFDGVERVTPILDPFKRNSRIYHPRDIEVEIRGVKIGGDNPPGYIVGQCSIEPGKSGRENFYETSDDCKDSGAQILRVPLFKTRTSPNSFNGIGEEGIDLYDYIHKDLDLATATEVTSEHEVDLVIDKVDIPWIGARGMRVPNLIRYTASEAKKRNKPILIKRTFDSSIDETLTFAEYAFKEGNSNVILMERGINYSYAPDRKHRRFIADLTAIPVMKQLSPSPVFFDPCHSTGDRNQVPRASVLGIMSGADGLMIEAHCKPQEALSDGKQSVYSSDLRKIIDSCNRAAEFRKTLYL